MLNVLPSVLLIIGCALARSHFAWVASPMMYMFSSSSVPSNTSIVQYSSDGTVTDTLLPSRVNGSSIGTPPFLSGVAVHTFVMWRDVV